MEKKPSCRIYVIKSPASPVAVVFRRGPSKQVQILKWDMSTDTFTPGQWFKGRIYERRCDVSPNGEYLIYFAATYKLPFHTWSAVSKLPYLTALTLWPKGDGWGGGGHFQNDNHIMLNHRSLEMSVAQGFLLPETIHISPLGEAPGCGEDDPIHSIRLEREGWQCKQEATVTLGGMSQSEWHSHTEEWLDKVKEILKGNCQVELPPIVKPGSPYSDAGPLFAVYDPPEIMHKISGTNKLEMITLGCFERNGSTYAIKYRVLGADDQVLLELGRADWADWNDEGDLLFAQNGGIYRLKKSDWNIENAVMLINLADARFEAKRAPAEFRHW